MRCFAYTPGGGAVVAAWPVCVLVAAGPDAALVARLFAALDAMPDLAAVAAVLVDVPVDERPALAGGQVGPAGMRVLVLGDASVTTGEGEVVRGGHDPQERRVAATGPVRLSLTGAGEPAAGPTWPLRWGVAAASSIVVSPTWEPERPVPADVAFAPVVEARICPREHANPPEAERCRICGRSVGHAPVVSLARPSLGVLRLSSGARIPLDRGVVFGRNPYVPEDGGAPLPNLVRISDPDKDISGQHLEVRLDGWQVSVIDLGSTNGTQVYPPHGEPNDLTPGEPVAIVSGTRVVLANAFDFVYDA